MHDQFLFNFLLNFVLQDSFIRHTSFFCHVSVHLGPSLLQSFNFLWLVTKSLFNCLTIMHATRRHLQHLGHDLKDSVMSLSRLLVSFLIPGLSFWSPLLKMTHHFPVKESDLTHCRPTIIPLPIVNSLESFN